MAVLLTSGLVLESEATAQPVVSIEVDAAAPRVVVARKATDESATPGGPRLPEPPVAEGMGAEIGAGLTLGLPAEKHCWGRFAPGAWRTLHTITESFDSDGKFIGRSETTHTDTLVGVSDGAYTIETTTVLKVGGKRLRGETRRSTLSLLTDAPSPILAAAVLPPRELVIEGRSARCQRWELTIGEGPQRTVETVFYNSEQAPYVLRRESTAFVADEKSTTETHTTSSVSRVGVPVQLAGEITPGEHYRVVSRSDDLRVEETRVTCGLAPGGLVSSSKTERDSSGRRVRWSVTELEDYGLAGEPRRSRPRWRLFRGRGD